MNRKFRIRSFLLLAVFMMALSLMTPGLLRGQTTAPADTQPAAADNASDGDTNKLNAWELYLAGGWFMYPLTACSVLALALIIERFLSLRRGLVIPPRFLPGLRVVARDLRENREAALDYCRANDSSLARMLAAGIKRLPRGVVAAEKAIEDAGANEALKLRRNMRFLYSLGSVATLLGLIGTISGMIKAFQTAATSTAVDPKKLSTGIFEAMVNTFGGLAVAILVTLFYYFFMGKIERFISDLNDALTEFSDDFGFNVDSDPELKADAAR
ncbi:MAG TPA: MotA/TolQ/ExbB proton channel family protein [Humisphaera sp.]|nr:MotA/TolQ/ExbB proton channel family protein [Humisphaera sp.]